MMLALHTVPCEFTLCSCKQNLEELKREERKKKEKELSIHILFIRKFQSSDHTCGRLFSVIWLRRRRAESLPGGNARAKMVGLPPVSFPQ